MRVEAGSDLTFALPAGIRQHGSEEESTTGITMAKKSEVDKYAIKAMVVHMVKDITESTYTVRDIEWLRADLEKISEENLS